MKAFQENQLAFTAYLRNPKHSDGDVAQVDRRQEIYRDLVYKNIDQCLGNTFPITKRMMSQEDWQNMLCDFIAVHQSHSPYFLEISQEFLSYLINERQPLKTDKPYLLELAHFEWIQLALEIANTECPKNQLSDVASANYLWKISPLVIGLTYFYPVHKIDEFDADLDSHTERTYLLIYRNRADDVFILETDSLTLRIVQLLQANEAMSGLELYDHLCAELGDYKTSINLQAVISLLQELADSDIIYN